MAPTLGTASGVLVKAGVGVSAVMTANANSEVDNFIEQAEAFICGFIKYDAVATWAANSALITSKMLTEYVERSAAIECIFYDLTGYTDGIEAENMVTVHWGRMLQITEVLNANGVQDFMEVN